MSISTTMAAITMNDCVADSACPVPGVGFVRAPPHMAGNAVLLAAFAVLIPINLFFGTRYRTPLYASFFIAGLLLEVMAHTGSILLRDNLASRGYYLMALLGAVTGPTFVAAAIFVVLPHFLALYGPRCCVAPSPLWIGLFLFGFDVFTFTFQIVGSVFFANGVTAPEMSQGVNILLAGMAVQAAGLVFYLTVNFFFLLRASRNPDLLDRTHEAVYLQGRFKISMLCVIVAAILVLARTGNRIAMLRAGPSSDYFQSETLNLVLDSALVLNACIMLTLAPPGAAFGRLAWKQTAPHLQGERRRGAGYALQSQRSPYFSPRSPYFSPSSAASQQEQYTGGQYPDCYSQQHDRPAQHPRAPRVPKPFEHQVPGHWQYPNLHKSTPRPKPVAVPKFEDTTEGQAFYKDPGSAGSRQSDARPKQKSEQRGSKRMSPGQRDLVDDEALW